MKLPPERHEYYKKRFCELLQSAAEHIRTYRDSLSGQAPQLTAQASRLWELSQRHKLLTNDKEAAAMALLTASNDAFVPLYQNITQLDAKLEDLAKTVAQFEREFEALDAELRLLGTQAEPLEILEWLQKVLPVLQSQAKNLELQARHMRPALIQSATVEQFNRELLLSEDGEACIRFGLARAAFPLHCIYN